MDLNLEQEVYLKTHLRDLKKIERIVEVAIKFTELFNQQFGKNISKNTIKLAAYVMEIGQSHPNISYIYEENYNWKEHKDAISLNETFGEYSVQMAESQGIFLTDEIKEAIIAIPKRKYPNNIALILKTASVYAAMEHERIYRGEKKVAAKSFLEIEEALRNNGITEEMIDLAKKFYTSMNTVYYIVFTDGNDPK
ncbi:MAG: hypothetical protein Q4D02_00790 [Clostridia bacterium]|nr:hypothetical protein [Clostridia bacterium]